MQTTLKKIDTVLLESNVTYHEHFFYDKIASKFDYNSSLLDAYMYYIIDEYLNEWDESFLDNPEDMLNSMFDGDVFGYVNQLRNDIVNYKNIVTNCYLAYVNIFMGYLNQLYQDDSDMSIKEAVQEVFYSINDEHLVQKPHSDKLNALSEQQKQDLDYILGKIDLDQWRRAL